MSYNILINAGSLGQQLIFFNSRSELSRGNDCSRGKSIVISSPRIDLNSFRFHISCYREWILNTFDYFGAFYNFSLSNSM